MGFPLGFPLDISHKLLEAAEVENRERHRQLENHGDPRRHNKLSLAVSAACGMASNLVSGTLGYEGLAGVFAVLGVVAAAGQIRRRDKRAPISRAGSWLFLVPAGAAATVAGVSPDPWPRILTAAAVTLIAGAVLLAAGLKEARVLLGRTALVGLALVFCRAGAFELADRNPSAGIALLLIGVAFAATGLFFKNDPKALLGVAAIILGLAFNVLAVALHANPHLQVSVALAGVGIGLISIGLASLFKRETTSFVTIVVGGAIVAASGAVTEQRQALVGSVVLCAGAYLLAVGVACMTGRSAIASMAVILTGVVVIAGGVPWHSGRQVLLLAPVMVGGIAAVAFGVAETDPSRFKSRLRWLVDPPTAQQAHTKRPR
jgi:hypothetical protein